jgi:drug/metabolite transporter (DMT)-like permease
LNSKSATAQLLPFPAPSERLVAFGLLALQIVFAVGYILSKVLVDEFPPLIWAWIRAALTAFFMLLITMAMRRPHPKLGRDFFVPLIWLSLLGGVLTQVFFLVGLKYTTSTNSAILNTLNPLITLLTVILMGREKATSLRLSGFLVSFCGVLILSGAEKIRVANSTLFGDVLTLASCITYGVFVAVSRNFFQKHDRFWITTWLFVFTAIGLTVFAIPDMAAFRWPTMTPMIWWSFLYGILGSSLLG